MWCPTYRGWMITKDIFLFRQEKRRYLEYQKTMYCFYPTNYKMSRFKNYRLQVKLVVVLFFYDMSY